MPYLFKSAVHLFLKKEDQILVQRRKNTGYMDGFFSVVAGHLEGDEDIYEAMIREAKEEVAIDLIPDDLDLIGIMHRKSGDERIDFFFKADTWEGNPVINEPEKADELRWVHTFPENTIPYIQRAYRQFSTDQWFDSFGL